MSQAILPLDSTDAQRELHYAELLQTIEAILDGEQDWVAAMATVACELHHSVGYFDWTGFYRVTQPGLLVVGPYQGTHGCLRITFERGVCGAAARTGQTQRVADVNAVADHIACSTTTRSELVVPIHAARGDVVALLDVDSNTPDAFGSADQAALELLCARLGPRFFPVRAD